MLKKGIWNPWELSNHMPKEMLFHSDKPSLQSFCLQKEPLTMFPSDLNEFSLQDFLFRWHYQKKLPYTITCGQWRLTGLSQTVSEPPRTGKYCLDLTLWSFPQLHLPACCNGSARVPCPVFLGAVDAPMIFTVGSNGCLWGACSMGAQGRGCREFVSSCDIWVHRIITKHYFFIESFPSPPMLLFNIHCMDVSSITTIWEECISGVFRTLMASLYIFWLCSQPGAVQPILHNSE